METMETMELTPDLFEPLDSAEKNSEFIVAEPRTYLSDACWPLVTACMR